MAGGGDGGDPLEPNPVSRGLESPLLRRLEGLRMYSTRATAIQHIAINRMLLEPAWVLGGPPGNSSKHSLSMQ